MDALNPVQVSADGMDPDQADAEILRRLDHLIPEDLQAVFVPVTAHRLQIAPNTEASADAIAGRILDQTPVP